MKNNFLYITILLIGCACGDPTFYIDESSLTYRGKDDRLFLDLENINEIEDSPASLILSSKEPVYLKNNETFSLKSGWTFKGKTGVERLVKKGETNSPLLSIKDGYNITVENVQLSAETYSVIPHSGIEIINQIDSAANIRIEKVSINNFYSGIWIKRGADIVIDECDIFDNAHQVYLGYLGDAANIKDYIVNDVTIQRNKIHSSKAYQDTTILGLDGIKTLSNCQGIKILNNLIARNNTDGIDLFPGGVDVTVRGNIIRDNNVHGIEVKMTDQYLPEQTGQIRNVDIDSNQIINNKYVGIACLDQSQKHYAQGIQIVNNQIDSSGQYAIEARIPIQLEGNTFRMNGLRINTINPYTGYSGIYFLNTRSGKNSLVKKNTIIDQAPIDRINKSFWMNINNPMSFINILENRFVIQDTTRQSQINKFGILINDSHGRINVGRVKKNNQFSPGFFLDVID